MSCSVAVNYSGGVMGKRKYWATYRDYFGNTELFGNTNNSYTQAIPQKKMPLEESQIYPA